MINSDYSHDENEEFELLDPNKYQSISPFDINLIRGTLYGIDD